MSSASTTDGRLATASAHARGDLGEFGHGQFKTDYESRLDLGELREARVAKARELLKRSKLDALLVWKDENVRYLTGMRAQLISGKTALLNGCLLLPDEDPIMLISGGDLQRAQNTMTWIKEFHPIPILEARGLIRGFFASTLAPLLERYELTDGTIGVDECSFIQVEEFAARLPGAKLADGDSLMQESRRVKFREEIALMEEAGAIAEAVTQAAIDAIRPGVRENDVVAEAMHALYRLGGEMAHVSTPFVASGEHMSPPNRLASDKIIREGDLVFIDIGAMWSGYFSDIGRTVVCGRPGKRQQQVYTAVYESLMAGTAACKAGKTNDDVARAINETGERHGFGENFITLFIGHGVGMGANEPPYVGEQLPGAETVPLETGMTFALEPLIWVPGVRGGAGVRLEDTIMVGDDGGRPLTRTAFDERLIL